MRSLLKSAMILALSLIIPLSAFAETFDDVSDSDENYVAIEYLVSIGTLEGYSDGTFQPDKTINRAELMKVLVSGQGIEPDEDEYQNCFPDVETDWYAKYVCYAYEQGWVDGYPDNTFQPSKTVNKVEAVKMLVNALGLDDLLPESVSEALFTDTNSSDWYATYLWVAKDLNLLEVSSGAYDPSGDMDRGNTSEYIFRTLVVEELDIDEFDNNARDSFLETYGLSSLADDSSETTEDTTVEDDSTVQDPNSVSLSGSGSEVTDAFTLNEGLAVIELSHSGSSNFIVKVLSTSDDNTEHLVNEIGDYDGVVAFEVDEDGEYVLDVDADGSWSAELEQPTDTSNADIQKSFSGNGMVVTDFFEVEDGLATFDFTHNGDSNFIAQLLNEDGSVEAYLTNEIGDYEGSSVDYIDEGLYILSVNADGDWTVDFDQVDFSDATSQTSFSGNGDTATEVFYVEDGLTTFNLTHEGSSNFIVYLINDQGRVESYLSNEIGDYEGASAEYLDAGYYIFRVQADGEWNIEIE